MKLTFGDMLKSSNYDEDGVIVDAAEPAQETVARRSVTQKPAVEGSSPK
jgi:hypothetical protein